jgi:signal transduction histidine kinase
MKARTADILGWSLATLAVILCALAVALWTQVSSSLPWILMVLLGIIPATYALIGALILSKRPDNGLGWLFAIGGLLTALTALTQVRYESALAQDPASSIGRLAAWMTDIVDPVGFAMVTGFVFLLYPTGHAETRASRRVALVAIVGLALATAGSVVEASVQEYPDVPTPLGLGTPSWVQWLLLGVGFSLLTVALIASVALLIQKLRRAAGREREQLRLLVWAATLATVLLLPALALPPTVFGAVRNVAYLFGGLGFLLIPVSVAIAILRLQLLDIDLVIRRTLMVALLGFFFTLVYVGIVVGVGALVGRRASAALSAIAVAIVAVAVQPVRRRAQRVTNRLVYGERATPYEVLHEFSERVAGSYSTHDVLPRMAAILGQGTGAERAQVWLHLDSVLRPTAVWPADAARSAPVGAPVDDLPELPDVTRAVAVRDERELLGALSITKRASDPPSPAEERLVDDLAHQAGLVLRNAKLVEDLRASRQRLVSAQDEERRRIERNIHDGAQQQLVALAVKARLIDAMVDRDTDAAHRLARELESETQETLQDVRELARGIYPPLLADHGLLAALENQARRLPIEVDVRADDVERHPREIEAAAYFCVLEAMQNVAKYAKASRVVVSIMSHGGELGFEVSDDGIGFDPSTTPRGSGLQNMADRLAALDGMLQVSSTLGRGTAVVGRIPLPAPSAGDPPV